MRNHFSIPSWLRFPCHSFKKQSITASLFLLGVWFSFPSMVSIASASNETAIPGSSKQADLLNLEIAGISLNTPAEKIFDILTTRGYTQAGEGTYLKEAPLAGGRKTLHRIEIEETASQRSIFYFRGESGGRVKSPELKNRPVPEDEATWARVLYAIVCGDTSPDEIQQLKACKPLQDWEISFGPDILLKISDQLGAQLDASGPSTTAKIVYFKR